MANINTVVNDVAKKGFKYRYNRNVGVKQGQLFNHDNTLKQARTTITSPLGTEYILDEYLVNNLTDYVNVSVGEKVYKYNTYLEAEVHVADSIAKE